MRSGIAVMAVLGAALAGTMSSCGHPAGSPGPGVVAVASVGPAVELADPSTLAAERAAYRAGSAPVSALIAPLLARADRDLAAEPVSVTAKTQLPPSGDRHDYLSLSVYAWPNPSTRDGRPYVIRDGQRNPAVDAVPDKADLDDVIDWSQELAYAYYFSDNPAYASKAATILRTWFLAPATRMNPNLTYAQGVPGASDGQPGGIIDTADLPQVVDAVALLSGSPAWTAADQSGMRSWFGSYLSWLQTSTDGRAEAVTTNNHATWYADQITAYALFVGDAALARATVLRAESSIIAAQITTAGTQPVELARADTWSYSTYNVAGLARLAQLAASVHVDLWTYVAPDGASIRAALDFVAAYADHLVDWPYPQARATTLQYLAGPLYAAAAAYHDSAYAGAATAAAATLPAAYPALALLYPPA